MKRSLLILSSMFSFLVGSAQNLSVDGQDAFASLFNQCVKSCDEFMCRFNEEEHFPGLDASDPQFGQKNFLSLFDYQQVQKDKKEDFLEDILRFYEAVKQDGVKLDYSSREWFAELRADFIYKKQKVELGIILQTEKTPRELDCWTIVGVTDLEKIGFADSTNRLVLGPEQHEVDFVEIDSDFRSSFKEISRFRSYQTKLNALSYFFALIESGTLTFNKRLRVVYHFFDVPSYVFTVSYFDRQTSNTGWLISDYKRVTPAEKEKIKSKYNNR